MSEHLKNNRTCEPKLEKINHVFSLKRSGHHAVLNWLIDSHSNTHGSAAHANNVYEGHLDPSRDGTRILTGEETLLEGGEGHTLFVNYEDLAYSQRHEAPSYTDLQEPATGIPTKDIIIARDYFNMMASRIKRVEAISRGSRTRVNVLGAKAIATIWKEYALYLDDSSNEQDGSPIAINYNRWFDTPGYRNELAMRFGTENADLPEIVPNFGGGSSFEGRERNGSASQMAVLDRWTQLGDGLLVPFQEAIEIMDDETDALNQRHFGIGRKQVLGALATRNT